MDVVRGPSYEGRDINEDIRKWSPEKNIRTYIYIWGWKQQENGETLSQRSA